MAIDSREKSASAVSVGCLSAIPPVPDGAIDAPDSAQMLGAYRGFFESAVVLEPITRALSGVTAGAVSQFVTAPRYLVELGFSTQLRYATGGQAMWNGQVWTGGRLVAGWAPGITTTAGGAQSGSLALVDHDQTIVAIAFGEGVADKRCRIWQFYGANDPDIDDPVLVFDGHMDGVKGGDTVRIGIVNEGERFQYAPRLFVEAFLEPVPVGTIIKWGGQSIRLQPRGR